jgi:hypothetical protein
LLRFIKKELMAMGAKEVRTATPVVHHGSVLPDYYIIKTDDCVIFPWDKEIISNLVWMIHPEYQAEINKIRKNK